MTITAASRWLLGTRQFRAAGLAPTPEQPGAGRRVTRQLAWPVTNGRASRALDRLLRPLLPATFARCRSADYGESPDIAGTVLYRAPAGGRVRAIRRRLTQPLLRDALVRTADDRVVDAPTGSAVVRSDDAVRDTHRLLLMRRNGSLLIVDSIGMPGVGVAAPLSGSDLDALAGALDTPDADVAVAAPMAAAPVRVAPMAGTM